MCCKACTQTGTLFPRTHIYKLGSTHLVCGWAPRDVSNLKLQANCACLCICALLWGGGPQLAFESQRVLRPNESYKPQP